MATTHKFTLGQRARCIVTGFEGIVTVRVDHLNGCVQYLVKPHCVEKDDEATTMPEGSYIDDVQLELVDEGILDRVPDSVVMGVDPASGPDMVGGRMASGGPSHREGELPR